jgi:pimeloyl-ACP methyl ester carboxylesterase
MEMLEVDGLKIANERAGSGPAVVFLHGYVGDGPPTWRRQLDGLSDEFTVVAWDARGPVAQPIRPNGSAWMGTLTVSPDSSTSWVSTLRLWAGLSFGGMLALALQRRYAAMSSALILVSAYAGWAGSLPSELAEQRLRQALALADGTAETFVGALLPTMFSKPCRVRRWTTSTSACGRSIRAGFGPWRGRPPRTTATYCPISPSRRCWYTATGMCERR